MAFHGGWRGLNICRHFVIGEEGVVIILLTRPLDWGVDVIFLFSKQTLLRLFFQLILQLAVA